MYMKQMCVIKRCLICSYDIFVVQSNVKRKREQTVDHTVHTTRPQVEQMSTQLLDMSLTQTSYYKMNFKLPHSHLLNQT